MRIPGILLREGEIPSSQVAYEAARWVRVLEESYPDRSLPILVRAARDLNTVYCLLAGMVAGRRLALIAADSTPAEVGRAKEILGTSYELDPLASVLGDGAEDLIFSDCGHGFELVVFSSGTSGAPKAIALSSESLLASARAHAEHFQLRAEDCWLASLALHPIGGISVVTRAFFLGQNLAFDAEPGLSPLLYWLESGRVVGASVVPTQLYRLCQEKNFAPNPAFRHLLVGGSELAQEIMQSVRQRFPGLEIFPTYGMSETASQILTSSMRDLPEARSGALYPLSGVAVRVAEDGELWVSGKMLFSGYYQAGRFIERKADWFATGDLAEPGSSSGSWKINGRKSDLIISGGVNISPLEVEAVFRSLVPGAEAALIGIPDLEWGERSVLVYSMENRCELEDGAAILQKMRTLLSAKKMPKKILFFNELPKGSGGKILRKKIREAVVAMS